MIKVPRDKWPLKFWDSGEWQALEERIEERIAKGYVINPTIDKLFRALELCPFEQSKVCILGQDPYPEPKYATGVAFSVPSEVKKLPPTLVTLFTEYSQDLGLEFPGSGSLEAWCHQGVLLWNSVPTCDAYGSLSHHSWPEWKLLTEEIVVSLGTKGIVFVSLGNVARTYVGKIRDVSDTMETYNKRFSKGYVSKGVLKEDRERGSDNSVIELSHPSPRASRVSRTPFLGSRVFSRINDSLCSKGFQPISWRLT